MHKYSIDDPRFFQTYHCLTNWRNDKLYISVQFTPQEKEKRAAEYGVSLLQWFYDHIYCHDFVKQYDDPDVIDIANEFGFMADELEESFEKSVIRRKQEKEANKVKKEFWKSMGVMG